MPFIFVINYSTLSLWTRDLTTMSIWSFFNLPPVSILESPFSSQFAKSLFVNPTDASLLSTPLWSSVLRSSAMKERMAGDEQLSKHFIEDSR